MSTEKNDFESISASIRASDAEQQSLVPAEMTSPRAPKDRVVGLPRSGNQALIWWRLTAEGLNRARRALEEPDKAALVLRVHRESESGQRAFDDLPLRRWFGHRWLDALESGSRLSISVGYIHPGGFVQIVGAAPVSMPSNVSRNEPVRSSTCRYVDGATAVESIHDGLPCDAMSAADTKPDSNNGRSSAFWDGVHVFDGRHS